MFKSCPSATGWLHPAHHGDEMGSLSPWLSDVRSLPGLEVRRVNALKNLVRRAVRGKRLSTADLSENSVSLGVKQAALKRSASENLPFFCRDRLSIVAPYGSGGSSQQIHIPMLLSDIVYAEVPGSSMGQQATQNDGGEEAMLHVSFIVAIGPRPSSTWSMDEGGGPGVNPHSMEPPLSEVWLLCIGNCDWDGMQRILFDLGSFGALRWDLSDLYEMKRHSLGTGGCGKVRLGQARTRIPRVNTLTLDKVAVPQVAMKMLTEETMKSRTHASIEKSIRSEVGFLARAHGHPNLSVLFGVFCSWKNKEDSLTSRSEGELSSEQSCQPTWCIVMDLCMEGDLCDVLDDGPLSTADALEMLLGLFRGLEHLHNVRIVHRDVKCENILISNGEAVLADFGIAACLDDPSSMRETIGSPGYVPPEVVLNKPYTEKVDIFAAGIVFYKTVTDTLPFTGKELQTVLAKTARCRIRFVHEAFRSMSDITFNFVTSLLDRNPIGRPTASSATQSLHEMVQANVPVTSASSARPNNREEPPRPQRSPENAAGTSGTSSPAVAQPSMTAVTASAATPAPTCAPPRASNGEVAAKDDEASKKMAADKDVVKAETKGDAPGVPTPPKTPKSQHFFTWARHQLARPFSRTPGASSSPGAQNSSSSVPAPRNRQEIDASTLVNVAPPSQPRPSSRRPRR
eukprot:TRINITY_DN6054_c0_g1_i1.p1 TRINITY_DN6054_c0_g1~~TRINITY_DN6054_c0_g1_i1.p1  ORF type:complete len:684 (-),score=90.04 TRINITY_DN6054_c0_g1_i1:162-2213(-)